MLKENKIFYVLCFTSFYVFSSNFNYFKNSIQMPSESKLSQDFKKEGFEDFIKKTNIVRLVAGKKIIDTELIEIGIQAQLTYQVEQQGFSVTPVFNKKTQNKIYSILFQNNLDLFKKLQEQGVL